MQRLARRDFLKGTLAGTAAGLTILSGSSAKAAPNDRINVAVIGIRGRGSSLANGFAAMPEAQVTHLCDIDSRLFDERRKEVAGRQEGKTPEVAQDLRRVLDDKSVDAIVVATPDHWHALATVWGCQAGKHVYVEKPASHDVWEGRKMVEAARKYDRVVQLGTQSRSVANYRAMVDFLRSGKLGKIHIAKAWNSQRRPDLPRREDTAAPEGVDYNIWQGPAPLRPFNENRFHYSWHWQWDYGTGDVGNDGVHDLDIARWGLGVTAPKTVAGAGAKFENENWQTPDTLYVTFTFPDNDAMLIYEQRDWSPYVQEGFENGAAFYGTEGYILAGRAGWRLFEKGNKEVPVERTPFSDEPHRQNFLDCIKTGERPHADIEEGHRSSTLAHLGNIVFRVGRCLTFDGQTETIAGDTEAASLLRRSYRKPFEIPEQV